MRDEMPALLGGVITDAHRAVCEEDGHEPTVKIGLSEPFCPRCGLLP